MRILLRSLLAVVLVGAFALGGEVADARPTQEQQTPTVEVLRDGSEPREALRLAPPPGASARVAMTLRLGIEQSGASDASLKAPPIRATIDTTLQDTTAEGNFHAAFTYPSFDVLRGGGASASQRRSVERTLADFDGLSGDVTVTPRGELVDSNLEIPPDADTQATQLLTQIGDQFRDLTVPLPETPVGVGARWRATTQLRRNGIETRQVYEYRLKKRTGTTLELDVRGTQTARRQTISSPGGVTLRVKSYKTTIRGTTTVDLTGLLPVESSVRGSGDQTFDVEAGDESGELRQHLDLRIDVKQA
jgi:Family of unknown function (DUF6263)